MKNLEINLYTKLLDQLHVYLYNKLCYLTQKQIYSQIDGNINETLRNPIWDQIEEEINEIQS